MDPQERAFEYRHCGTENFGAWASRERVIQADGAARIKGYEVEGLKCSGTARRPEGLEQNEVVQRTGAEMRSDQ